MISISSTSIRAVLFDLNGTLIHDGAAHRAAFREVFAQNGVAISDQDYEKKVANHLNRQIWPAVLGDVQPQRIAELTASKEQNYRRFMAQSGITPGAFELIQHIHAAGLKVVLVTTAQRETVKVVLKHLGLEGQFNEMVTGEDVSIGKPDPEIYLTALDRLEIMPSEALAFEDSPQGVQAAMAASIRTIGVLSEYAEKELSSYGVKEFITSFDEVIVY